MFINMILICDFFNLNFFTKKIFLSEFKQRSHAEWIFRTPLWVCFLFLFLSLLQPLPTKIVRLILCILFIVLRTHISLLCFSDTYFATHSPRIYFINLGHSSLSISKNSNRGTCYREWTLHPLSTLYYFTVSRKMIDQKDFRNRGLLNMSPLNFSIYKLYNLELTLSHSCSN